MMNIDALTHICIGACLSGVVGVAFVSISKWLGGNAESLLFTSVREIYSVLSGKKYILLWNDDEIGRSNDLCRALREAGVDDLLKSLGSAKDILHYPLKPARVKALILIVTDVTKFSDNEKLRELIERKIHSYIDKGGGVVGTHDIAYRRVRNTTLQKDFGVEITTFRRVESPVKYIKNKDPFDSKKTKDFAEKYELSQITKDLPDEFELNDGEIIVGKWEDNVAKIFISAEELGSDIGSKPLVTARKSSNGRIVWLNSGDKYESFPESISLPEREFLILLKNSIEWVSNAN